MPAKDRSASPTVRSVRIALCVGLALLAVAVAVVLSGSPLVVVGTNSIAAHRRIASVEGGFHTCQSSGTLPAGTTAIRVSASANTGPRLTLTVRSRGRLIDSGERDEGWGVDETATVPIKRVPRTITGARICIAFGPVIEPIGLNGTLVNTTTAAGKREPVAMLRLEYLRAGRASWWSLASSVARRLGYGHQPSGRWVAFAVIALMLALVALVARLLWSETR